MEWDRPAGDQDGAYEMFRGAAALRRGVGRDFLVFGRLLRPRPVSGIEPVAWTHGREANELPSVEHATWQAPDGRVAVALANWTDRPRSATLDLGGRAATYHVSADGGPTRRPLAAGGPTALSIPPRACALLVLAP
jgi:hypothetical protein